MDHGDGTVTDLLTGLMWLEDVNKAGTTKTWADALTYCNDLNDSGYDDWRLPNVKELQSLIDFGQTSSALPSGHPFSNVVLNYYWSSTSWNSETDNAWIVHDYGYVDEDPKATWDKNYVWPVCGGQ